MANGHVLQDRRETCIGRGQIRLILEITRGTTQGHPGAGNSREPCPGSARCRSVTRSVAERQAGPGGSKAIPGHCAPIHLPASVKHARREGARRCKRGLMRIQSTVTLVGSESKSLATTCIVSANVVLRVTTDTPSMKSSTPFVLQSMRYVCGPPRYPAPSGMKSSVPVPVGPPTGRILAYS